MKVLKPDDKRITDLKAELDRLIKESQKPEAELARPPRFTPDTAQASGKSEMSVVGTFNAAAAAGLGKECILWAKVKCCGQRKIHHPTSAPT